MPKDRFQHTLVRRARCVCESEYNLGRELPRYSHPILCYLLVLFPRWNCWLQSVCQNQVSFFFAEYSMTRFTLKTGVWYAGLSFGRSSMGQQELHSPIRVLQVCPQGSGNQLLTVHCFLGNDPDGDGNREYRLQTIERSESGLLARVLCDPEAGYIHLSELSQAWMEYHFPQLDYAPEPQRNLELSFRDSPNGLRTQLSAGSELFSRRTARNWSTDPYWKDAYLELEKVREDKLIQLDLVAIESQVFRGDSIAYRLMEAMVSVWQKESWDGYRGAPRLLLLALAKLCNSKLP